MKPTDLTTLFPHVELELAAALGVDQSVLRFQRSEGLARGVDWELVKGKVAYSEEGWKKIVERLTATPPSAAPAGDLAPNSADVEADEDDEADDDEEEPTPAAIAVNKPGVVDLICHKLPRNRRIILARLPGQEKAFTIVRVRVKDSEKFRAGMELKARHLSQDLYELEGNHPRFAGRF